MARFLYDETSGDSKVLYQIRSRPIMYFRILHDELGGQLSYLLSDLDAGEAVLIDPHASDVPILRAMLAERDLRLQWILRTHHHDKSSPPAALVDMGVPMIQGDAPKAKQATCACPAPLIDELAFGNEVIHIMPTPGHTSSCLSFLWRDRLFCGGLLAFEDCPHQPRPGDPKALWDSVKNHLFLLPDETLLFSGHDRHAHAVSTVLEQRRFSPYFSGLSRDQFLARMENSTEHRIM